LLGCFTPGLFMNYITCSFREPWLIIVMDLCMDHEAIHEVSYINIPIIALVGMLLRYVDVAIPMKEQQVMLCDQPHLGLLALEVLCLHGTIPCTPDGWNVMVNMFFYCDPEEVEKQQQEEVQAKAAATGKGNAPPVTKWDVPSVPVGGGINPALATQDGDGAIDWAAELSGGNDWAAEPA
ncbi:hypothetical protein F5148DRAFT_954425, partial [Russula earlei]